MTMNRPELRVTGEQVAAALSRDVGDQLLRAVATRINRCCGPGQWVARMGGDEFVIVIEDSAGEEEAVALADIVLTEIARPIRLGEHELTVTTSIGVVERPVADANPADLLQAADLTLHRAKARGKARYAVFNRYRNDSKVARVTPSTTMLAAVERDEFFLDYQPLVGLKDGLLVGVEALVRWRNPTYGLLGPERFIDLAVETGSIVQLGYWILTRACEQAAAWRDAFGDAAPLVSVNVALQQLHDPVLVSKVGELLDDNRLDPSSLQLELTEHALIGDEAGPHKVLTKLYNKGVRIAIDDFGTGYWNLPDLRRLPVHELKLADSFAVGLQSPSDLMDQRIVAALVDLAHALELTVTAQGIDTYTQLKRLRALRCDGGQGALFGMPNTAEQISVLLQAGSPLFNVSEQAPRR
jgi:diguanylate cyclase (GGDEF)-like protein